MIPIIKSFKNYLLKLLLIFLAGLLLIAPFIGLQLYDASHFHALNQTITHYKLFFTAFRWSLIFSVFFSWPRFIAYYATQKSWSAEKIYFWRQQRQRIVFWLILFEVLVCQNGLFLLIRAW